MITIIYRGSQTVSATEWEKELKKNNKSFVSDTNLS